VFPFLIMLIFTGVPLFFLETAFGQYASNGVVNIWKAVPLCQGQCSVADC
jgi:SNF family Na+-dependent transporter